MKLLPRASLAAILVTVLVTSSPAAQSADADPGADSVALVKAARKAQAAFERTRQFRLPWTFGGGTGRCDEIVGRYCVRHDRGDDAWEPPPEHRDIAEGRDVLLRVLRETQRALPGDEWTAGQRVSYLLDARRPDDALDAVRACGAPRWWCDALEGLVRHERGETELAERAFHSALGAMPPDERTRWMDLRPLLGDRDARLYERADSAARDSLAAVLWWLADPLWMRAGNDRLTEQYSRHVRARISRDARSPDGEYWRWDLEELLLRMGWPSGWERRSMGTVERSVSIVTHRAPFGREFLPSFEHSMVPFSMAHAAWDLTPAVPLTEYSPRHARFDGGLAYRVAVLPDGDSVTVAAVMAFRHDSVVRGAPASMALVAATPGSFVMDSSGSASERAVRSVRVPRRDLMLSLEAVASAEIDRAARARFGAPLAQRDSSAIVLSDPLLLDAGSPPVSRDAAIARMLLPGEESSADSVGVYFEAARLAPDVPVEVELTLEPGEGGALRRFGEAIGIVAPRTAVRLAWTEAPPAAGRLTRAVTLGFAGVPAGQYALRLRVQQGAAWGTSEVAVRR